MTGREGGRGVRNPKRHRHHHHIHSLVTLTRLAYAPQPSKPAPVVKSRPFWHDEQVERDDYAVYAPAVLAEGTGREVTSLTPAVVQVSFSTMQPVAGIPETSEANP